MTALNEPLLSVSQVSKLFRVQPSTVRGWIRDGDLRALNTNSKAATLPCWKIDPRNLEEFRIARSTKKPKRKRITAKAGNEKFV